MFFWVTPKHVSPRGVQLSYSTNVTIYIHSQVIFFSLSTSRNVGELRDLLFSETKSGKTGKAHKPNGNSLGACKGANICVSKL